MTEAISRIERWMAALAVAGAGAGLFVRGWQWSAGFVLGAAVSWLNFRWMKKLVLVLGDPVARGGSGRSAVVLGLRYLILAAAAYVIVRFTSFSLAAAFLGLFVAVGAVIMEILFELVYART